jgi:hypothetical protein
MRVQEGTELQHKKHPWYTLRILERTRGGWLAAETHLGEPWSRKEQYVTCVVPPRDLKNYEYQGK